MQDYLKEIHKLRLEGRRATTSAIAERLGVRPPSATAMIKKLASLGLADYAPYRGVELTDAGERVALEVIRHHRLLEQYLAEALGLPLDEVHVEADRLEHVLSEDLERLGVRPPSATAMIKKLASLGLADYAPYRGVELTDAGERVALEVIRHHRLLEQYLAEALGLPLDEVHVEADRLEHVLSEELE